MQFYLSNKFQNTEIEKSNVSSSYEGETFCWQAMSVPHFLSNDAKLHDMFWVNTKWNSP